MTLRIDRCVCRKKTFALLKDVACAAHVSTTEELAAIEPFGDGCGLCKPYVRRMLKTGQTEFNEILTEDDSDD